MKILVLAGLDRTLVLCRGGLLRALRAHSHDVVASAPADSDWVAPRLAAWGVRFRAVPLQRAGLNPVADLRAYFALKELFAEEQPDFVLNYAIKPVIYGSLAARAAGVKRIHSLITGLGYTFIGDTWKQRGLRAVATRLYRTALRHNQSVIFQNQDDRAEFASRGIIGPQTRVHVVNGSGVDLAEFPAAPVPAGAPVFLMIARLLRDKGVREYVEAARQLRRANPAARFLLVGPLDPNPASVTPAELAAWVREGVVEHTPWVDDVRPRLRQCTVFVLPSYREGTPRSTLEALATGRAVVTTDAPGCRETVIDGQNGFLVPVKNSAALASALEKFIREPALATSMGARSRSLAEERFNVKRVNEAMFEAMGLSRESKVESRGSSA